MNHQSGSSESGWIAGFQLSRARFSLLRRSWQGTTSGCIERDVPSIDAFNGTDDIVTLKIAVAGVTESETRTLAPGLDTILTDGRDNCTNVILDVSYPGGKSLDTFEGHLCKGDTLRIEDEGITLDEG